MFNKLLVTRAGEGLADAEAIYLGTEGVVLQDGSNTCGPAALKMILEHHAINISLHELERKSWRGGQSMTMLDLKYTAGLFGVSAKGWRLSVDDLSCVSLPAILFVENTHFVVLDSIHGCTDYFVRDPAKGKLQLSRTKLLKMWKGETLLFYGSKLVIE